MPAKKVKGEPVQVATDGTGAAFLTVHKTLYPKDVLFGTAFTFLDRCYVHLDMADADHVRVSLRVKPGVSGLTAEQAAGEFGNEMVNQAVRLRLAKATEEVRTEIVKRAIGSALPAPQPAALQTPPPLPDLPPEVAKILAEEDDNLDFLDDPLGIAVPWEEKYGKKEGSPGSEMGASPSPKEEK